MTGLTVSTTGSAMPSVPGAAPSVLAVGTPSGVPGLAAFIDMMADQADPVTGEQPILPDRQEDAEPGNSLPDQDSDQATDDPALAWLMAGMQIATLPVPPAALPKFQPGSPMVAVAAPQDAPVPAVRGADAPPPAGIEHSQGDPAINPVTVSQSVAPVVNPIQSPPATAPAGAVAVAASDATPLVQTPVEPVNSNRPMRVAIDPTPQPAAPVAAFNRVPSVVSPPAATSTARMTVAMPAMFALAAGRRDERDGETTGSPVIPGAALLQPADAAKLIAQPGEMQRQTLDMSRQDWPQKMIDRIETLRDNADANDTSIRLKPEALGQIDVSIRTHADGAVSVKFTAEQPTVRALIADAQPQLTAAAEARGIRLSGTSVDLAGSGQGGGRPRQQAETNQNTSNRLAPSGDDIMADTSGRIA